MAFNELNSVEHYIIHQLSGVNLNSNELQESKVGYGAQWQYKSATDLNRSVNEVLIEQELRDCLIRLNPEIAAKTELADEVIYKLRAILISVNQIGLVKANEEYISEEEYNNLSLDEQALYERTEKSLGKRAADMHNAVSHVAYGHEADSSRKKMAQGKKDYRKISKSPQRRPSSSALNERVFKTCLSSA
jgi:chorismate-pyruvate lyase